MASDYTMVIHEDVDLDVYEDPSLHHHHHPHNMSSLSVCTNSTSKLSICSNNEEDDDGDDEMSMLMSRLSIDYCSDGDANEEFSDDDKEHMKKGGALLISAGESSDSYKDLIGCLSLPGTPTGGRDRGSSVEDHQYWSENESVQMMRCAQRDRARRSRARERWLEKNKHNNSDSPSTAESECFVIARPNGGRRSLCMDLEEVRACRDLGFQLEHERISMPSSSGGNSPIANWKISSPGDDPKDIKARLKVWAQAVVLDSASQLC